MKPPYLTFYRQNAWYQTDSPSPSNRFPSLRKRGPPKTLIKNEMKRLLISILFVTCLGWHHAGAQSFAIKNNLLYDAIATPNLGVEIGLGDKTTLEVMAGYNPWTLSKAENKKIKHVMVMPEFRYWFCEKFNGHFIGAHTGYAFYNIGGVQLPHIAADMKNHRYQGWATGLGVAYGYQWVLSKRWNIEASVGAGWVVTQYDKYQCVECGRFRGTDLHHYFGPTKAAVSFIYIIK